MQSAEPTMEVSISTLKALASGRRLQILEWLKHPRRHFPPQVDGDLRKDGVCADFIRGKLGVSAATASQHLRLLVQAELLIPTPRRGWTFYRRNEVAIARFVRSLERHL